MQQKNSRTKYNLLTFHMFLVSTYLPTYLPTYLVATKCHNGFSMDGAPVGHIILKFGSIRDNHPQVGSHVRV